MNLTDYIKDVPDFPEKGIVFRDISPLLADSKAFKYCISLLCENVEGADVLVGLDARGFIFGSVVAYKLGIPFILVRKSGKLPRETVSKSYNLEYGDNTFEIHKDAIIPGQKVALIDDVLATGGSMKAACDLVEELGGYVYGIHFLMELAFLHGGEVLAEYDRKSLVIYN